MSITEDSKSYSSENTSPIPEARIIWQKSIQGKAKHIELTKFFSENETYQYSLDWKIELIFDVKSSNLVVIAISKQNLTMMFKINLESLERLIPCISEVWGDTQLKKKKALKDSKWDTRPLINQALLFGIYAFVQTDTKIMILGFIGNYYRNFMENLIPIPKFWFNYSGTYFEYKQFPGASIAWWISTNLNLGHIFDSVIGIQIVYPKE